jgi:hypothetical protein
MVLHGDCLPPIRGATAKDLCYWFGEQDNFGEWLELRAGDGSSIAIDPVDDDEFERLASRIDDPDKLLAWELWVVTCVRTRHGPTYEAVRRVTTQQARRLFQQFMSGGKTWYTQRQWRKRPAKPRCRRTG